MQWSKLKSLVEERFAHSLRKRVGIYTTRYTQASYFMVRGWITVDGEEIANFSTPDYRDRYLWNAPEINLRVENDERTAGAAVEKGEFEQWEFISACWDFTQSSLEEALLHPNPIVNAFAMLDKRLGKRRLREIEAENLHPLAKKLLEIRLEAEGLLREKTNIQT